METNVYGFFYSSFNLLQPKNSSIFDEQLKKIRISGIHHKIPTKLNRITQKDRPLNHIYNRYYDFRDSSNRIDALICFLTLTQFR